MWKWETTSSSEAFLAEEGAVSAGSHLQEQGKTLCCFSRYGRDEFSGQQDYPDPSLDPLQ